MSPIYIIDIHWIFSFEYMGYFRYFDFYGAFLLLNVTHCDYVLIFSRCVLLVYDVCPQHFLGVGQLLLDYTSPQQSSVNDESTLPKM